MWNFEGEMVKYQKKNLIHVEVKTLFPCSWSEVLLLLEEGRASVSYPLLTPADNIHI